MEQQEIDKQHELQRFVDREVIYCVSGLICTLSQTEELHVFDEFPEIYEGPPSLGDYTCPTCDYKWKAEPDQDECPECSCNEIDDDRHFDPTEYREIYEHWIVSDWLADRLAEYGEAVCKDFYGLTVWGRTCTGQGIALDGIVEDIYNTLHAIKA